MHSPAQTLRQESERTAEVDEFVVAFYERTVGRADFTPSGIAEELGVPQQRAEHAVGVLLGLRLVKPAEGGTGRLVAVSPEAAQVELLVPWSARSSTAAADSPDSKDS